MLPTPRRPFQVTEISPYDHLRVNPFLWGCWTRQVSTLSRTERFNHGKAASAPATVGVSHTCAIYQYRSLTMTSPQILVSAYDRGRLHFTDFAIGAVPSSFMCTAPKRAASGTDDFAYLIPLDCLTSTPVHQQNKIRLSGIHNLT